MSLSSDSQWQQFGIEKKSPAKDGQGFSGFCEGFSGTRQASSHAMPQPTGLPWNIQDMSWSTAGPHPGVMEFTATPHNIDKTKKVSVLHCKRKSDLQPNIPSKQLITEEKMAAYFDGMHISGEYGTSGESGAMDVELLPAADRLRGAQRIVLSQEIHRIRTEPIIPPALLQRLEKPCTSLVLWQPPRRIIDSDKDPNNNPDGKRSTNKSVLVSCLGSSSMDMDM